VLYTADLCDFQGGKRSGLSILRLYFFLGGGSSPLKSRDGISVIHQRLLLAVMTPFTLLQTNKHAFNKYEHDDFCRRVFPTAAEVARTSSGQSMPDPPPPQIFYALVPTDDPDISHHDVDEIRNYRLHT